MDKWQNASAGPRQVKDLNTAISALTREGQSHTELSGVIGGKEWGMSTWSPFGGCRPEVTALDAEIRAKYDHTVTRENVRAIIADYEAATVKAAESTPVIDNRRTAEQDAELQAANAERRAVEVAAEEARGALMAQIVANAPRGAKALIYAEYREDCSDSQSDYFANRTTRTVAIGWRFSTREDFRQLRAAAGQFPETAHLASQDAYIAWLGDDSPEYLARQSIEHRDNYSMGGGNYVSDFGGSNSGTGWLIKSADLPCKWVHVTEDAIPVPVNGPRRPQPGDGPVTVSPSSIGREGIVEIRFAERPADEVLASLKAHGFRWAKSGRCWYGPDGDFAQSFAPAPVPEPAGV